MFVALLNVSHKTFCEKILYFYPSLDIYIFQNSPNKKTVFLKLHVPWEICLLYAERMRMKLPLKLKEEDLSALKTRRSILQKNLCFSPATADKKVSTTLGNCTFNQNCFSYILSQQCFALATDVLLQC